jgi:predicted ATPase
VVTAILETTLATLERALEHFGFPLSEFVPLFAALLSLPNDHRYPPPAMTPQRQKQKTFEAIVAILLKEAQQRLTWIVGEDVHWADPSTPELLSLLIEQVSRSRLFVVLIFRPDFLPPWRSQPPGEQYNPRSAAPSGNRIHDRIPGRW